MAKKSLKKRIDALVDAIGGAEKPTLPRIRSELVAFGTLADELEGGQTLAEKDARIADLETQLCRLQVELKTANTEIKAFREEEKKREKEEADWPDVQCDILRRLPSENSGIPWTLREISYMAQIPVDEAEIHIDRLERTRLIKRTWGHSEHVWYRTIAGSQFVLAKRLAVEEQQRPKRHKHADLLKDAHEVLLLIARSEEGIKEFELTTRCAPDAHMILGALHKELFFNSDWGPGGLRAGRILTLARNGAEYLTERGLL